MMLRQRAKVVGFAVYVCDIFLIIAAFFIAYWVRGAVPSIDYGPLYPIQDYLRLLFLILPVWTFLLYYFGLYESSRTKPLWAEPWSILQVGFWGTLFISMFIFSFKLYYASRLFIFIFWGLAFLLLSAGRLAIRAAAKQVRRRGYNYRNVIVVGDPTRAEEIADTLNKYNDWGLKVTGIVVDREEDRTSKIGNYPVVGIVADIVNIIENQIVDEIIFAVSRQRLEDIEEIFLICEEQGIRTRVAVNFFPHIIAKTHVDDLDGIPMLTFTTTPHNELPLAFKRLFDILAAGGLLISLSPLCLLIAIAIKVTSRGPIFFRQVRVGLNGRRFTLYKFRSMVEDAEAKRAELLHLNEMDGPAFKVKNDPRLTRIGRFLRRTSLDESPQLVNVLKGDMSIVGPRPPVPEEVLRYERRQRRRLSMKPGLTCIWQVQGRNKIRDFDNWVELDLWYIDNWSLKLDFKIFFKTVPVVLSCRGAS